MTSDETEQLLNDHLACLASTTDKTGQRLVEQDGDLVNIIAQLVDVV